MQAVARVHRVGQIKPVTVYQLMIADTVEVESSKLGSLCFVCKSSTTRRAYADACWTATEDCRPAAVDRSLVSLTIAQLPAAGGCKGHGHTAAVWLICIVLVLNVKQHEFGNIAPASNSLHRAA